MAHKHQDDIEKNTMHDMVVVIGNENTNIGTLDQVEQLTNITNNLTVQQIHIQIAPLGSYKYSSLLS